MATSSKSCEANKNCRTCVERDVAEIYRIIKSQWQTIIINLNNKILFILCLIDANQVNILNKFKN